MTSFYEIKLAPKPQRFAVTLGEKSYTLSLSYHAITNGGWVLDIEDVGGTMLVAGIPLVTGTDLLGQYEYLGIGVALLVMTDGAPYDVPLFTTLGTTSHLYVALP